MKRRQEERRMAKENADTERRTALDEYLSSIRRKAGGTSRVHEDRSNPRMKASENEDTTKNRESGDGEVKDILEEVREMKRRQEERRMARENADTERRAAFEEYLSNIRRKAGGTSYEMEETR
ncbi:hypothetical protein BSKO_01500 [Bryopsis sp. KO-2023]|nr:hypothetical protein BSKO_01500 [Bryopsis sp. KO-2023]